MFPVQMSAFPESHSLRVIPHSHVSTASHRDVSGLCFPLFYSTFSVIRPLIVFFFWSDRKDWKVESSFFFFFAVTVRLRRCFRWKSLLKRGDAGEQQPQLQKQPAPAWPFNSDKLQRQQHAEYLMPLCKIAAARNRRMPNLLCFTFQYFC